MADEDFADYEDDLVDDVKAGENKDVKKWVWFWIQLILSFSLMAVEVL